MTIVTSTAVLTNVANPADGSDGSVMGTAVTGGAVPVVHLHTTVCNLLLHVLTVMSTDAVTAGTRTGPTSYNRYLVKSPTGDLGLTSSGHSTIRVLTATIGCSDLVLTYVSAHSLAPTLTSSLTSASPSLASDTRSVTAC